MLHPLCYSTSMTNKLQELVSQYLYWQKQKEKTQEKLDSLKEEIVALANEKKIKKIKSGKTYLYIITQSETRFPQLGEPGRKEVEKIVKESGELEKVMVFDIIELGNAYDEGKLSQELMKKLQAYAKRVRLSKIRLKELNP